MPASFRPAPALGLAPAATARPRSILRVLYGYALVSSLVYDSHVRASDDHIAQHLVPPSHMATEAHGRFLAHQNAHHEHVTHYGERGRKMDFLEDEEGEIGGHDGVVGGHYF